MIRDFDCGTEPNPMTIRVESSKVICVPGFPNTYLCTVSYWQW